MSTERTVRLLNRLLQIEYRSLAMYLLDARPWTHPGGEKAEATLRHIIADQRHMAERIARLIGDLGGVIETGEYPMEFTDLNLLSIDYLMKELIRYQQHDLQRIERLTAQLSFDRQAHELAQEVLGMERAHLEALQELVAQPA